MTRTPFVDYRSREARLEIKKRKIFKRTMRYAKMRAGQLCRRKTTHELIVENILLMNGVRFEVQKPFAFHKKAYVVDFYLTDLWACIEIDGPSHFTNSGIKYHAIRARRFRAELPHIKFLRYGNHQTEDIGFENVLLNDIKRLECGEISAREEGE